MKYGKYLFLVTALMAGFSLAASTIKEGKDYKVLNNPIKAINPDKIELIEIFSYHCGHCKEFDPILKKYEKTLNDPEISFRNIHVYWAPEFMNLIRLTVAINDSNLAHTANEHIFNAVFNEKINLLDEKTTINWLNEQTKFDGKKVAASFQTANNKQKAQQMSTLTAKYNLENTPTIIVGEKYEVNLKALKSEKDLARILNGIIDLAKKDKNSPINAVINTGGQFATQANQSK